MRKILFPAVALGALLSAGAAQAACGDVTLAVFSWQSAEAMSNVDQFILKNGYGCNATTVAGDTVPTITAMIEKGQPDISSESTPSLLGDVYKKGAAEGRISQIGTAISDGQVSGWYIPKYVADAHPDIKTVDDAMKHPELFPAPEDPSKGGVIQGPQGWGDTVVTAQLYKAIDGDKKGFTLVPTGSAAALDGVISKAYEQKQGLLAQYWAPTSLLVKYPMVRLEMAHDDAEWARCTSKQDCPDPKPNYWKPAEMVTLASSKFLARDDVGPVKDYLAKRSWTQAEVGKVMLWMTDNQANGEDGAKWFIKKMPDVWTKWVPADVAEKVKAAL
ncbi:MAG: ABC transporter substrate-binding protein [Mesorhizobium sp.]|uniref:glycine betaine ABC transporter substrate-binding protein n=1 Tax=unclassified Mesorhizobium TaxID=325217 RepID=UPI000F753214|nr:MULTISPECIES: glycine betaine ABC transporter substrate-binding protein [unclassified Mesorhizobium]AZO74416.1 ABC transporter substrate-binding protein [Mesorhizobium sp. M1D.F.Ca.ET.043.01.1.1]RWA96710.1 MAG: ABC transporter substrate-binding protein [Mesorhizobium sp.]RWE17455.1 MAG: ABC transporter substrate-binding protein [Mesorhizobium sp.]TJW89528.1 MAG: ABC transporter substrate-binding protein [Mesorhizobium sp.]